MPESIAPAFFQLNYHSEFGPHVARIPTLGWTDEPSIHAAGTFDTWDVGSVDAFDMIEAYVDACLPFFWPTTTFDNFIIYTQPDPDDDPQPRASLVFTGKDGTDSGTTWSKAVQRTLNMRTTNFGLAKYVFLDAASGNNFDRINAAGSDILAFINVVNNTNYGFAGRDNGRPNAYIGVTTTLNEKLRRAYRMT